MSIFDLSACAEREVTSSSTICIVGAGLAGILAARRIAQQGQRVIVLESGGGNLSHANELNRVDDPTGRYTRSLDGRHRGLGGTSSRWGGRMIPISEHDAGRRDHLGLSEWPFRLSDLSSYDAEIESLFGVAAGSCEDIRPEQDALVRSFPVDDPSLMPRWAKCPSFKHCNIATLLDQDLRRSRSIDIWLGATVCDFELDREGGRLSGLIARDFDGRTLHVRAERFILAAGTIETTRLLLLLQAASQDRAFSRCQVLGRYFQDHLKAEVATISRRDPVETNRLFGYRYVDGTRRDLHLELAQDAQRSEAVTSAFAYVTMDLTDNALADVKKLAQGLQRREFDRRAAVRTSANLGLLARAGWWRVKSRQLFVPPDVQLRLMTCVEQLPHWTNRIRLSRERDRLGSPMALLEWSPTEAEERTFRAMVTSIAAYWKRAGFDRAGPLDWTPAAADISMPIIARSEACAHPSGSTRMGTDPVQSVVGPDLRCHEVSNLAVASASVFPSAGSANPTLTIMKMALWLADSVVREDRRVPGMSIAG